MKNPKPCLTKEPILQDSALCGYEVASNKNSSMETAEASQLLKLDPELLATIMNFIDTRDLFPSCFLVCKPILKATLDELAWQVRCRRDLQVCELHIEHGVALSWFRTYQCECNRSMFSTNSPLENAAV